MPAAAVDALFTEFHEPDHTPLRGRSITQVNALEVSRTPTAVTCFDLYRTDDASSGAEHVDRRERSAEDGELQVTWTATPTPA